jgi:4-amino-4-deoxy-L-arabinose transferase-like glycosyltransferase
MATAGNFHWHEIYRTPFYPIFLSPFIYLFGQTALAGIAIVAAQRILGVLSVVLFYKIARSAFTPAIAFYSSLLFSLHTLQLYYETVIQTEVLFVFFFWCVTFVFMQRQKALTWKRALALGALCACFALTRPLGQFVILLVLGIEAITYRFSKKWLANAALSLFIFALVLFPWFLTNKKYYGFFGLSQDLGLNLFHRIIDVERIQPREDTAYPKVKAVWERVKNKKQISYFLVYHALERARIRSVKADRLMAAFALETLKSNPNGYLKNSVHTFRRFFFDSRKSVQFCQAERGMYLCTKNSLGQKRKAFANDSRHTWLRARRVILQYFKYLEAPMKLFSGLALLGMLLYAFRPARNATGLFLVGMTFYFAGLTAIFNIPEDRFRLPIDPVLFLFAVVTVVTLFELLTKKVPHDESRALAGNTAAS